MRGSDEMSSPTPPDDLGGDPACWAHLDETDQPDPRSGGADLSVWDLGLPNTSGPGGAVWNLPHGGDLDANLVHLHAGEVVEAHVNHEVDVAMYVQSGRGEIVIDGTTHQLRDATFALVPKGARRRIWAGPSGITFLSIHRRRGPLSIRSSGSSRDGDDGG